MATWEFEATRTTAARPRRLWEPWTDVAGWSRRRPGIAVLGPRFGKRLPAALEALAALAAAPD